MTRKTLGILVMAPVLFFALDKSIAKEGGGKDKETKTAETQNAKPSNLDAGKEGTSQVIQKQAQDDFAWNAGTGAEIKRETKITELKATLDYFNSEAGQEEFYAAKTTWYRSDEIPEGEVKFFETVMDKLKETNVAGISLRSFSRCPSGYSLDIVLAENGKPTNAGYIVFRSGCSDECMGYFRYDAATLEMEVLVSQTVGFVPLDEYLSLYKEAIS